jgi:hypothetical protein
MERLLKHALDNNAVDFIGRMKEKMSDMYSKSHTKLAQKVAADMAGVEVQERLDKSDLEAAEKALAKAQSNYEIAKKKKMDLKQPEKVLGAAEAALKKVKAEVKEGELMHVFVHASGKGIKWRTSDQRTGGEANFKDQKDEKKLRAYFTRVFGSKKEFTLEIRENDDTEV